MRLVDTSAWIEWLMDTPTGQGLAPFWPPREETIVPTLVQFELAKWAAREVPDDVADRIIAYTQTCRIVALDTRIALLAADLAGAHRLATADAIIYATAIELESDCLTCDRHFEGLDHVVFVRKDGA
jgi:predicted nucleic acid-binding protein